MGTFGRNGEEGGGHTHGFSEAYNGKAGAAEVRQDMGDAELISNVKSSSNIVNNDLDRETTGDGVTVGGAVDDF